jgi:pimeloyl-ACP methyl ester carboxylesterase
MRIAPLKYFNEREAPTMDLRPRLKDVRVPALILVGRQDFITTPAMAEEMARHLPKARVEVFQDSGHFALVEEPEKFYQVVKRFILA